MGHSLVMLAFRKNGQKSNTDRQTVYPKLSIQNKQNYHLTPKDLFVSCISVFKMSSVIKTRLA